MLKCYLGAFMGTLILIYALAYRTSCGRGHIPLPHPPPWAAKATHYFNFSHVSPLKFLGQIKPWLWLIYVPASHMIEYMIALIRQLIAQCHM